MPLDTMAYVIMYSNYYLVHFYILVSTLVSTNKYLTYLAMEYVLSF